MIRAVWEDFFPHDKAGETGREGGMEPRTQETRWREEKRGRGGREERGREGRKGRERTDEGGEGESVKGKEACT